MSLLKKREIPIAVYIISSLFILFSDYTGEVKTQASTIILSVQVLMAVALVLGLIQLGRVHVTNIYQRKPDWPYSLILLITFMTYLSIIYYGGDIYIKTISLVFTPINLAVTLGGFTTMTILFHGARITNIRAFLLLFTTVVTALFQAAIGPLIPGVVSLGTWLTSVPNTGVSRAIIILMGVGLIALFVRALLGIEKSYMGEV